ncbi:globin domain-containing protein [Actinomadura xylanilytica]|uniref:globin domain-containing protein n=1 Tax=Actinomadura xylanilytica TaxID=887459 RepID=UPI00255B15AE|nr:globin domain-containing protein [Actinomadura xylanilytica]MDL4776436.1 globin domain-containing protein [Actinomadura xylanilytica]
MSLEPRIVKESLSRIQPVQAKAARYFYGRLFAENPRMRALFPPGMDVHHDRLFQAIGEIVGSQDSPETLAAHLGRLGRAHRRFGVQREHYAAFGTALVATLRAFSDEWSTEIETAWTELCRSAADTMSTAAERDAERAPPWWVAEVVGHDRRAHDLAVLTLRPGCPLPFVAGQHVTVQTSRWPRVWRPYSIANAPRPDGTLRLHVRAVPAGWVSGALVRHTRPGDTVLLGPAAGGMTLDPGSGRDLLLVAGGTGLAPARALAEQAARSGAARAVRLLVGARTGAGLYDLPGLRALESECPRLRVTPVVSGEPGYPGLRGALPDVLDRFPDLAGHDVHVAGPAPMVRETVTALQRLGVPLDQIRHDLLEAERRAVPVLSA